MSTNDTMNALIRGAARQDRIDNAPQPQWSTPSDQPRHADISAGATGAGMPGGAWGDPNRNSMLQWARERGLTSEHPMEALREAVAEKRSGRRAGWR